MNDTATLYGAMSDMTALPLPFNIGVKIGDNEKEKELFEYHQRKSYKDRHGQREADCLSEESETQKGRRKVEEEDGEEDDGEAGGGDVDT